MVGTKLENTVRAARDVDVFVLALILNVETVGLYKIARQIAALTGKVGEIAYTIIYPELSRLSAADRIEELARVCIRVSSALGIVAFVLWVAFVVFGAAVINVMAGHEFSPGSG